MLSHENQAKENVCYDAVEQCSRECWRMAPGGWNGSSCNLYITRSEIGVMLKLCSTNCADLGILLHHIADHCEVGDGDCVQLICAFLKSWRYTNENKSKIL